MRKRRKIGTKVRKRTRTGKRKHNEVFEEKKDNYEDRQGCGCIKKRTKLRIRCRTTIKERRKQILSLGGSLSGDSILSIVVVMVMFLTAVIVRVLVKSILKYPVGLNQDPVTEGTHRTLSPDIFQKSLSVMLILSFVLFSC